MPTVIAYANKGYVWNQLGSTSGQAVGTLVPHGGASFPYLLPHYDFSWPSLPAGSVVTAAVLKVRWSGGVPPYTDAGAVVTTVQVYEVTGAWTEGGSMPSLGGVVCNLPVNEAAGTTVSGSILAFVQARYSGTTKYGIGWGSADYRDSAVTHYGYDQTDKPQIEITYVMPPTAPTVTSPNGGESINTTHTVTWTAATDPDTAQGSLRYQIQISTNNKGSWSDLVALTAAGATSQSVDFSAQPESSTCFIRIRAYDGAAYGPWDESNGAFTIAHNVAPLAPTGLSPSSGAVDRAVVQRLSWTHQDAGAQSKFDLQWSSSGGSSWTTVTQATPNQYWDAPANTFPAGQILWKVRTYDQGNLVGPYSAQAAFTAGSLPSAPVITFPTNGGTVTISRPTVQWSSSGQAGYQVQITTTGNSVLWDSGQVTSEVKAVTVGADLANGLQAIAKVRIRNSIGLWSAYVTATFTVNYTPPAIPGFSVTPQPDYGRVRIQLSTQTTEVASNDIYRRAPGAAWVRIATGVVRNGSFDDYTAGSGIAYEYQADVIGTNGVARAGNVVTATLNLTGVWIHQASAPASTATRVERQVARGRDRLADVTLLQFAGRALPVAAFGGTQTRGYRSQLLITDGAQLQALVSLFDSMTTLCVRDNSGRVVYGVMPSLPVDDQLAGHWTLPLDIQEVDYTEGV